MKYQTTIRNMVGAGLVLGSASVMASGEHAGWAHDPVTGTMYHYDAPAVERSSGAAGQGGHGTKSQASGAWTNDSHSGTFVLTRDL